jgi:hypothetical protein
MYPIDDLQLADQLDKIVDHVQRIRGLDLASTSDLERALEETQDTLGALALYRKWLYRAADYRRMPQVRVA